MRGAHLWAGLALLALTFAAYSSALGNAFYNDDALFLNHAARVLEAPGVVFREPPLGYLRPVWSLWFATLVALAGKQPFAHHLAGVLLHAATAFLVYHLAWRLLRERASALAAGAFFAVCYAHSEAGLWISAHNSTLVCFFALAALLAHLRALETDTLRAGLVTALCVALTLLTKEPGIVATLWLPLAEWRVRGLRACLGRRSLVRYGFVAAVGVGYLALNPRLLAEAFSGAGAGASGQGLRSTLGFVTVERLLGTTPWLYSPVRHVSGELAPWLGAGLFAAAIALAALGSRRRLGDVLLSIAMLLIVLATSCSTRAVQFNGSRLYYFPTAGAALLLGAVCAVLADRAALAGRERSLRLVLGAALALLVTVHAAAVRRSNRDDYGPISRSQTQLARSLGEVLGQPDVREVHVLEPWLDNRMHAREFLACFAGVPRDAVGGVDLARDEAAAWMAEQRALPGVRVLDCDAEGRVFPAVAVPNDRQSAQHAPRAADSGVASPRVGVLTIENRR